MIETALSIEDIAARLGGDVVSRNMVRAPAEGGDVSDRSLMVLKKSFGLIVIPPVTDAGLRERRAETASADAYVRARLGIDCGIIESTYPNIHEHLSSRRLDRRE